MVFLSRILNIRKKEDSEKQKESVLFELFLTNANLFMKIFKEILSEKSKKHNWDYKEGTVSFDFEKKVFSYFHDVVSENEKVVIDMIESFEEAIVKIDLPFSVIDFDDEHIIIGLKV